MAGNKDLVLKQTNSYLDLMLTKDVGALPAGFNPLRFKQNAMTVLSDTNGLEKLQGNEYSLARTIMEGAYLGLDFFNKECYCIIYGNKAEFQTDYKGEIKLAKKYSINPVKDIYAKLVREGDDFEEYIKDGHQTINFKPKSFNNGEIIGAFAVCLFQDGGMIYEAMSKEEIEEVRKNYSKVPNGPSWTKSKGEMYKKTVLRRLCKLIELDFETIEQQKAFEEASGMEMKQAKKEEKSVFEVNRENEIISDFKVDTETGEVAEGQQSIFEGSPFEEGEK